MPAIRGLARGRTLILVDGSRASTERRAGAECVVPRSRRHPHDRSRARAGIRGLRIGCVRRRHRGAHARTGLPRAGGTCGSPARAAAASRTARRSRGLEGLRVRGVLVGVRAREFDDYDAPVGRRARTRHGGMAACASAGSTRPAQDRWSVGWQSDFGRALGRPRSDSDVMPRDQPVEDSHRLTASYERPSLGGLRNLRLRRAGRRGTAAHRAGTAAHAHAAAQHRTRGPVIPRAADAAHRRARSSAARALHVGADVQGRYGLEALDTTLAYNLAGRRDSETATVSIESAHRTAAGCSPRPRRRWPAGPALRRAPRRRRSQHEHRRVLRRSLGRRTRRWPDSSPPRSRRWTRLTLTAQVARGFRDPMLSDRFYRGPVGRGFVEGNPDLKPETSLQFDVSARYVAGRCASPPPATTTASRTSSSATRRRRRCFFSGIAARADLRGVEVEAQATLPSGFAVEATAETSRGRDAMDGTPLDDIAPAAVVVDTSGTSLGARMASYLRIKAVGSHDAAGPSEVPTPSYTIARRRRPLASLAPPRVRGRDAQPAQRVLPIQRRPALGLGARPPRVGDDRGGVLGELLPSA